MPHLLAKSIALTTKSHTRVFLSPEKASLAPCDTAKSPDMAMPTFGVYLTTSQQDTISLLAMSSQSMGHDYSLTPVSVTLHEPSGIEKPGIALAFIADDADDAECTGL